LPSSTRRVVLCADDFGLTEGVSRAILDLARARRISATSVITTRPWWPRLAPELASCSDLGIGLHLNLTTSEPLGTMPMHAPHGMFPSLAELLRGALLGRLQGQEIRDEIERQLSAFAAALGRPPDFVDGHQHVHVLPGIRAQLLSALKDRGLGGHVWLRDPSDRSAAILARGVAVTKALSVKALAAGFAAMVRQAGFSANQGFSGFSPFDPARDLAADFGRFFKRLGPRPVVMCHPGRVDAELRDLDPVLDPREREYAFLASEQFLDLVRAQGISLVARPP
jgi:predicted glycoside hydrolase/deacetylase ChbG (UPF0249 family)